jgi:hypothetical protein
MYRSGAKHQTMVPSLLLVFTTFEVLEGPMHEGNELETSNCNSKAQCTMQEHHSAQRYVLVQ